MILRVVLAVHTSVDESEELMSSHVTLRCMSYVVCCMPYAAPRRGNIG